MSGTKVYPKNDFFLLCEDIREEKGGKYSLIGVFVGGDIQLTPGVIGSAGVAMPSLSIFARFSGGVGEFRQRLRVIPPVGDPISVDGTPVELKEGVVHMANLQMRPFSLPALGTYRLELYFDDEKFEFPFDVSEQVESKEFVAT